MFKITLTINCRQHNVPVMRFNQTQHSVHHLSINQTTHHHTHTHTHTAYSSPVNQAGHPQSHTHTHTHTLLLTWTFQQMITLVQFSYLYQSEIEHISMYRSRISYDHKNLTLSVHDGNLRQNITFSLLSKQHNDSLD